MGVQTVITEALLCGCSYRTAADCVCTSAGVILTGAYKKLQFKTKYCVIKVD